MSGRLLHRGETYWVGLQRIRLTRDILVREKSLGNWHYDVIDDINCGAGKFGSAYKILAVLKNSSGDAPDDLQIDKKEKRIYKYQKNAATHEYDLMKRCPHLQTRALFSGIPSLISMRKFPGILLNDALNNDRQLHPFTHAQRYRITISLLRALKKQMHDNMICHRDLKPDNIFYDPDTGAINIFDLGVSQLIGVVFDRRSRGNATFSAPEDFTCVRTQKPVTASEFRSFSGMESKATVKSDIYSMAKVIGLVWRDADPIYFIKNIDHTKLMLRRILNNWEPKLDLFMNLKSVGPDERSAIERQLRKMTAFYPDDRPNLTACIETFDQLYLEYKISKSDAANHDLIRRSHQLAWSALSKLDEFEKTHDVYLRLKEMAVKFRYDQAISLNTVIHSIGKKFNHVYKVFAAELIGVREQCHFDGTLPLRNFLDNIACEVSLTNMHSYVQTMVSNLEDNPVAVIEFIETLNMKCLAGLTARHELHKAVDDIFNTFMDNIQKILQLLEHAEQSGNDVSVSDLNSYLTRLYSERLNLDSIHQASAYMARKIQKLDYLRHLMLQP